MHTPPSRMATADELARIGVDPFKDTTFDLDATAIREYGPLGIIASIPQADRLDAEPYGPVDRFGQPTTLLGACKRLWNEILMTLGIRKDTYEMPDENTMPLACWEDERGY